MRKLPMIHHLGRCQMDVRAARSSSVLIVAVALGLAGVAHAQESANPGVPLAQLAPPSLQPLFAQPAQTVTSTSAMPGDKDPATALSLSVLGTAAGTGMLIASAQTDSGALSGALGLLGLATSLVGPSMGHFYAGETGRGVAQIGVRAGGTGLIVGGAFWLLLECFPFLGAECEGGGGPAILMASGLVVTTGSALYSIYDAPRAARRQNARARRLVLTPAPLVGPDHSSGFGLHLGGQF
jgi:hypothetical protein